MATRFYLPASGTAPLGSLAADASWTRTDNLDRRPCNITKSNTSLTQKSATWQTTASASWGWVQFQSKRLAAGYSWTTADTVSMVIKVAEAAAQVDSHLAYCIRVVSGDGSVVRGTIGVYQTTSSEYPTSLAAIATRIHSARTDGASAFSSQAGDRIIIEIGHWGVTPTLNVVYHNYGDPTAVEDYALTAALTSDLCPWVELSRDVSFDLRSSKPAYMVGSIGDKASKPAYTNGANPSFPASSFIPAYLKGLITDIKNAYLAGSSNVSSGALAYMLSNDHTSSQNPAFTAGTDTSSYSRNAFLVGSSQESTFNSAFIASQVNDLSSIPAYTVGDIRDSHAAFLSGPIVGPASDTQTAYLLGWGQLLKPDGDIGTQGSWKNELEGTALYPSLDETDPADSDYVYLSGTPQEGDYFEVSLSNPSIGIPAPGDVAIHWRGKDRNATGNCQATIQLRQGAAVITTRQQILSDAPTTYVIVLTAQERAEITDWNDLRIRVSINIV